MLECVWECVFHTTIPTLLNVEVNGMFICGKNLILSDELWRRKSVLCRDSFTTVFCASLFTIWLLQSFDPCVRLTRINCTLFPLGYWVYHVSRWTGDWKLEEKEEIRRGRERQRELPFCWESEWYKERKKEKRFYFEEELLSSRFDRFTSSVQAFLSFDVLLVSLQHN